MKHATINSINQSRWVDEEIVHIRDYFVHLQADDDRADTSSICANVVAGTQLTFNLLILTSLFVTSATVWTSLTLH